jgi:hypothetical protein
VQLQRRAVLPTQARLAHEAPAPGGDGEIAIARRLERVVEEQRRQRLEARLGRLLLPAELQHHQLPPRVAARQQPVGIDGVRGAIVGPLEDRRLELFAARGRLGPRLLVFFFVVQLLGNEAGVDVLADALNQLAPGGVGRTEALEQLGLAAQACDQRRVLLPRFPAVRVTHVDWHRGAA